MKLSWTLGRYMALHYLAFFAVTTACVLMIVFIADWLELVRKSVTFANVSLDVSAEMSLARLPFFFQKILPFTTLLASLFCYSRFMRNRELIVARSMGLSPLALLLPVLVISFLLGMLVVTMLNPLTALSLKHFHQLDNRYFRGIDSDIALSPAGFWLRESHDEVNVIIHARNLDPGRNLLKDVSLIFFDKVNVFKERWDSPHAQIAVDSDNKKTIWHLHDVLVTSLHEEGDAQPRSQRHKLLTYAASLSFDKIQDNFTPPEAVSVWSLPVFSRLMEGTGFSARRHLMYYYFLLLLPFFIAAMGFLAAVFALQIPLRGRGVWVHILAITCGFLLFLFSEFLYSRGEAEQMPFFIAAFVPVFVATLFGGLLLLYSER